MFCSVFVLLNGKVILLADPRRIKFHAGLLEECCLLVEKIVIASLDGKNEVLLVRKDSMRDSH